MISFINSIFTLFRNLGRLFEWSIKISIELIVLTWNVCKWFYYYPVKWFVKYCIYKPITFLIKQYNLKKEKQDEKTIL